MTYQNVLPAGKIGQRAQTRLAEIYKDTVNNMLSLLRSGMLIHSDETKVKLQAFDRRLRLGVSSTETVVYLYNPTREGTFLKETLGDFAGVLVSDFTFTAYDSVTCRQQKCHLHLMRDINDDLLHHPFDEELKELAKRYTHTLKQMVETIDKHGLKPSSCRGISGSAKTFLDWIAKRELTSEVAQGYESRIEKYGEQLSLLGL